MVTCISEIRINTFLGFANFFPGFAHLGFCKFTSVVILLNCSQTNMADVSQWNPDDKLISKILNQVLVKAKENGMFLTPNLLAQDLASH